MFRTSMTPLNFVAVFAWHGTSKKIILGENGPTQLLVGAQDEFFCGINAKALLANGNRNHRPVRPQDTTAIDGFSSQ